MSRNRKYSDEFRAEALRKMGECANVSALARELGIRRKWLYAWRDAVVGRERGPVQQQRQPEDREKERLRRRVAELEQLVGRQSVDLDFFKGALRRVEARRQRSGTTGGAASTSKSN